MRRNCFARQRYSTNSPTISWRKSGREQRFTSCFAASAWFAKVRSSRSVYVVVSGRFEVWIEGQKSAINEIGVGEPIGEIGFFAGVPRTATIIAD